MTSFAVALGASAGNSPSTCTTMAVAVLAGQLSIGWSNDRLDAELDRRSGRTDKPLAAGAVTLAIIDRAVAIALLVTVLGSLALGWRAGLLHLLAVGCGWLYNLGLKATALSWLPYAVAFGSVPAVAALALPQGAHPTWWALGAGALLGAAAHLANALPDLIADRAFGITGFPHRVGARASVALSTAALLAATGLLVLGPPGPPSTTGWVGVGLAAAWALSGAALAVRRPHSPVLFRGTVALAALDVALLMLGPPFVRG